MLVLELNKRGKTRTEIKSAKALLSTLSEESEALRAKIREHDRHIEELMASMAVQAVLGRIKELDTQRTKADNEVMGHLNERMDAYFSGDFDKVIQTQTLLVQKIEKLKFLDSTRKGLVELGGDAWQKIEALKHEKASKLQRLCDINVELASAGYYRV